MSQNSGNRRKPTAPAPRKPEAAAPLPARENARRSPRTRVSLRAWREQHAQSFRASLRRLLARPGATALTLLVMSLALTLPLLLWLLLDNARGLGGSLDDARAISAFLKPSLDAAAAEALARKLRERDDVAAVVIKTPDEGLAEFRAQSGFADALKLLQGNPLPTVLIISPRAALATQGMPALVADLEHADEVDLVQYDALWRQRLDAILLFTARLAGVLALLLGLAALLVVGNTVRLDVQGRAEEIGVVKLLGASNAFVRRPFLYTGLCYGTISGLVALALVALVEQPLAAPLQRLMSSYGDRFGVHGLSAPQALALVAFSAALGFAGAWLATSRHLALVRPR
ncbi:MAG: permease-like cell division protein FtsX [Rudaea sp.]